MRISHIKNLRTALIGLILAVMAAVLLNYIETWRTRRGVITQSPNMLGAETLRSVERIEYSDHKNGIQRFKILADRLVETRQGNSHLEGIEAFDFDRDGTIRNYIRSRRAEYDGENKRAFFSGDVRIEMGRGIEIRTDSLKYDLGTNIGETADQVQIYSKQANGTAKGISYNHEEQTIHLLSDVDIFLSRATTVDNGTRNEKGRITSNHGFYSGTDQVFRFSGDAVLESENSTLSGNKIEALLSSDGNQITALKSQGNAVYQSKRDEDSRRLSGDFILASIDPLSGMLDRIESSGSACLVSMSPQGEQRLCASELTIFMDPVEGLPFHIESRGRVALRLHRTEEETLITGESLEADFFEQSNALKRLTVSEEARLATSNTNGPDTEDLRAEEIRITFKNLKERNTIRELQAEGSVRWKTQPVTKSSEVIPELRTLTAGFLRMLYHAEEDYLASGSASGDVVVTSIRAGESKIERMKSDSLDLLFYPRENTLKGINGEGNVEIFFHKPDNGEREVRAQEFYTYSSKIHATFKEDGTATKVSQWGNFRYRDESRRASSGRAEYWAERDLLSLTEKPKLFDSSGSTTGELIEYDLQSNVLTVSRRVRTILLSKEKEGESASTVADISSSTSVVIADTMKYWEKESRTRYSGTVQMLSEEGQLQSRVLDVLNEGELIEAEGAVEHLVFRNPSRSSTQSNDEIVTEENQENGEGQQPDRILIRCSELKYAKQENSIRYTGDVTLQTDDVMISSQKLKAVLDSESNRILQATARGNVLIRQSGREVTGKIGEYDLALGKFIVTGYPAEIFDPVRGKSHARRLTLFTSDDRILLENR